MKLIQQGTTYVQQVLDYRDQLKYENFSNSGSTPFNLLFYSSSIAETGDPNDLLGVIISYSIRATLVLSGMGGELVVDLPFKLVHPKPGKQTKPLNYRNQNCIN